MQKSNICLMHSQNFIHPPKLKYLLSLGRNIFLKSLLLWMFRLLFPPKAKSVLCSREIWLVSTYIFSYGQLKSKCLSFCYLTALLDCKRESNNRNKDLDSQWQRQQLVQGTRKLWNPLITEKSRSHLLFSFCIAQCRSF